MKELLLMVTVALTFGNMLANDGAYYGKGNTLIPINEKTIKVQKEILNIKKVAGEFHITVYYEFDNPGVAKKVLVGFEANCPYGDVSFDPIKSIQHPFMKDFTVNMNGKVLPFKIAKVHDSHYFKNGKLIEMSKEQLNETADADYYDFFYVYHFEANFQSGINKVTHTYKLKASSSVMDFYNLTYVLTGATRWANQQIDDFTLNIDLGELQCVDIEHNFFKSHLDWNLMGAGTKMDIKNAFHDSTITRFYIRNGILNFHKTNFKPGNELYLNADRLENADQFQTFWSDTFDAKTDYLYFANFELPLAAKDEWSLKLMKNLPYARRGYVFNNKELQAWFEKMPWYLPDPNYMADLATISEEEKKWLKSIK